MKGIRIIKGYVQARIMHKGQVLTKQFGQDNALARSLADIWLGEQRKAILMGKVGITPQLPQRKFKDLVPVYLKMWSEERDGDGRPKHSERAFEVCKGIFDRNLLPYFGDLWFDEIRSIDVEKWRVARLNTGVLGTSVNREQVPLSSMFSLLQRAVDLERIPAFRLPLKNPCLSVEKAKTRKRGRIPTDYELKKLKLAFTNLSDNDGWEICKLALKSILSEKDLRKLELGSTIDLERSKTGVPIHIPITVLQALNWKNWRKRWEVARKFACLADLQFRDLRKKGGNHLVGKFDTKLVSQYFGHASVKTTEQSYVVIEQEKMRPLAEEQEKWVESL